MTPGSGPQIPLSAKPRVARNFGCQWREKAEFPGAELAVSRHESPAVIIEAQSWAACLSELRWRMAPRAPTRARYLALAEQNRDRCGSVQVANLGP